MMRKAAPLLALVVGCATTPDGPVSTPADTTTSADTLVPVAGGPDADDEGAGTETTATAEGDEGEAPPDVDGPPASSTTTASGLSYLLLTKGNGSAKATEMSKVLLHYSGWTTDGRQFDTTRDGGPVRLRVDALVAGLIEGLQLMGEGDHFRFWIPTPLAYGDSPRPDQPKGMLVFDVEVFEIHD